MASELAYDPAIDNCANMPGCGDQRVLFTWYGPAICCPRCYENLFGAAPDPASIITLPAATPGQPQPCAYCEDDPDHPDPDNPGTCTCRAGGCGQGHCPKRDAAAELGLTVAAVTPGLAERMGEIADAAQDVVTKDEVDRCGWSEDPYHRCRVCYDYAAGRDRDHPLIADAAQEAGDE